MNPRHKLLATYLAGIASTVIGAWLMDATGSMFPMALGASATLLCTASTVKGIVARARR